MEYINTAKIRRLVSINREKRFVASGEKVFLSPIDISMLGANAAFLKPYKDIEQEKPKKTTRKKTTRKKTTRKKRASKKTDEEE